MSKLTDWFNGLLGIDEIDEIEDEPEDKSLPAISHKMVTNHEFTRPTDEKPPQKSSISVFVPSKYTDCKYIADKLKGQEIIIVNYNMMTTSEARKVFYFAKGCVYALDGTCETVSNNIFVYLPKNIGVQTEKGRKSSFDDTLKFSWPDFL